MGGPSPKPRAKTWRQRGLPGVNAPVPPGGKGVPRGKSMAPAKLQKLLRKFDSTKEVAELAPYDAKASAWFDAAAAQLAQTFGDCGPLELAILRGAADQMFWAQVFFDRARKAMGTKDGVDKQLGDVTKIVAIANSITDGYRTNIIAASELRAARAALPSNAPPPNPLAAFDVGDAEQGGEPCDSPA